MSIKFVLTVLFVNTLHACSRPALPGDVGTEPPPYAAASLTGDSIRLKDLKGHPVLLNVWATWCSPCKKEIPELQALHQQYGASGLEVIGISIDGPGANADVVSFVRDFGITYTIARDPANHISRAFRFQGVPGSVLIDRVGIVRWRYSGQVNTADADFQDALRKTLARQ